VPSDASPPAVSCRAVSKVYAGGEPVVALERLDLEAAAGEFLALVGESGSGKSTLLHLIGGIDRPTSGQILVGERAIETLTESALVLYRRREVGMVFQFFNLLPHLTVRQNVELPGRLDGREDAALRAGELLERVGLSARAGAHPYELSGGEMQRVAIARGLATGARLLLADEPTGNLDSRHRNEVLRLLDEVRRERGVTLLLATHSAAAAERADRTVELRDGRIVGSHR
jgi:putative ABC transport system ATP-binding protein